MSSTLIGGGGGGRGAREEGRLTDKITRVSHRASGSSRAATISGGLEQIRPPFLRDEEGGGARKERDILLSSERSRRFARLSSPPVTCVMPPPLSSGSFIKPSRNFPRRRSLSSGPVPAPRRRHPTPWEPREPPKFSPRFVASPRDFRLNFALQLHGGRTILTLCRKQKNIRASLRDRNGTLDVCDARRTAGNWLARAARLTVVPVPRREYP